MRLNCLIFLAVISVATVTECKPLSDGVETAPCIDCKQKNLREKRSFEMILKQAAKDIKLNIDCPAGYSCEGSYSRTYEMTVTSNGSPDIYLGNGQNIENYAMIKGANNVYIGNGDHNTNYVSINS